MTETNDHGRHASIVKGKRANFSSTCVRCTHLLKASATAGIIIFHLSKLWQTKFFILCDVIFLVKLQGIFAFDQSWEWKGQPFWWKTHLDLSCFSWPQSRSPAWTCPSSSPWTRCARCTTRSGCLEWKNTWPGWRSAVLAPSIPPRVPPPGSRRANGSTWSRPPRNGSRKWRIRQRAGPPAGTSAIWRERPGERREGRRRRRSRALLKRRPSPPRQRAYSRTL